MSFSIKGYLKDSPDRHNPYNIIKGNNVQLLAMRKKEEVANVN